MNYITFFIILAVAAVINAYGSAFSTAVYYWQNKWFKQVFANFVNQRMAEGMTEEEAQQLAASHKFDHTAEIFQITGQLQKSKGCTFLLCLAFALSVGWIIFEWYIGIVAFIASSAAPFIFKPLFPGDDSDFFRDRISKRFHMMLKSEKDSHKAESYRSFLAKLDEF
jgi:hypothetical protein